MPLYTSFTFFIFLFLLISAQDAEKHRCQKCLKYGHWTYECTNERKYVHRESRTVKLSKKIKLMKNQEKKQYVYLFFCTNIIFFNSSFLCKNHFITTAFDTDNENVIGLSRLGLPIPVRCKIKVYFAQNFP